MNQKDLNGRFALWAIKMQGFSFCIEHRKGSQNIEVDALSRAHEDEVTVSALEVEVLPEIDLDSQIFKIVKDKFVKAALPDYQVIDKYL